MKNNNFIIDGHVHVYEEVYDTGKFFESALANLDKLRAAVHLEPGENAPGFLLLTEGAGKDFFAQLKENPGSVLPGDSRFAIAKTAETCSLALVEKGKENPPVLCYILRGKQIVSKEKLEVLALATDLSIEDKRPIGDVIDEIIGQKHIAVLAWGVGKWFGKRGQVITGILQEKQSPYIFVGDNSARPVCWPTPKQFKLAQSTGRGIINGSDSLPFRGEEKKAGSYSFHLQGNLDPDHPARSFREALLSVPTGEAIPLLGVRDSIFSFFRRQLKMNLKKHLG